MRLGHLDRGRRYGRGSIAPKWLKNIGKLQPGRIYRPVFILGLEK